MKGCWWLLPVLAAPACALPTMVRIGYPNCVSCHVSPQGGGLLNDYGRGIDDAQSLRAGEYAPGVAGPLRRFTWNGRADQDVRAVLSDSGDFRSRFYYRNVTSLGKGWRLTMTAAGEHAGSRTAYLPACNMTLCVAPSHLWRLCS